MTTEMLAGSGFFLGIGLACYAFYRTGYLQGWEDCVRRARELQLRKPVNLAFERLKRRIR